VSGPLVTHDYDETYAGGDGEDPSLGGPSGSFYGVKRRLARRKGLI
jgi:hypothetical protein